MKQERILIIDFGGQNNQSVARKVRDCSVYCEVHPFTISIEDIKEGLERLDKFITSLK